MIKKKLRNKETGRIGYLYANKDVNYQVLDKNDCVLGVYNTLPRLIEEWEDYEEPKQWYGLNAIRDVGFEPLEYEGFEDLYKHAKELGIAFETEEEAKKAVEKLKAWTRLKDKGFRFVRIDEQNEGHRVGQYIEFEMAYHFTPDARQIGQDLDLLFGGEE